MARRRQHFEIQFANAQLVSVVNVNVWESRPCGARKIDVGAGALGQFPVTRDEVSMQVGLEDVSNREPLLLRGFQIDFDIALGIDDDRFALRSQHVRGVRQTA